MAESGGVSGVAVGLAAAGGLLMYAGIQGVSPLEALKDVTSGKTKSLNTNTVAWTRDPSRRSGGDLAQVSAGGGGGGFGGSLVTAARRHRAERYSQARRWQSGYSDCSSFVGKSLKDLGIKPPGASVTGSYLTWSKLRTVPRAQMQAGDLLCGAGHIAIATGPGTAIGQQNSRSNVQEGPAEKIMFGQPSWVVRRYVGAVSSPDTAAA
ncbi:NlpC/P60 family protein [Streptomyces sp. NPDC096079]|uniref:NlpC/P60 family protein n=1 Tax=Streptomyces sp. NPDC096079 TaxID=3155820 RepID=UPI0033332205